MRRRKADEIRADLGHPVIDADAHIVEYTPGILDIAAEIGGMKVRKSIEDALASIEPGGAAINRLWNSQTPAERHATRTPRSSWWGLAGDTYDRATAMFPSLLYERLPECGIDFCILYPSLGLTLPHVIEDAEARQVACRAYNTFYAEACRKYSDRLTPAAIIPMVSPTEALEALEHAVEQLGLGVVMLQGYVTRPVEAYGAYPPPVSARLRWIDVFGMDSDYDYDPVWNRCQELGVNPSFHSPGMGWVWAARSSTSSFMYNQIGHFADADEALAKALFFGGVLRRFPHLRFAFLEGGVCWGARLLQDLASRWGKRGGPFIDHLNPLKVDREWFVELVARYGGDVVGETPAAEAALQIFGSSGDLIDEGQQRKGSLDEFKESGMENVDDLGRLYAERFFFGCEGDDRLIPCAWFNGLPAEGGVKPMFGSDIGHWDVGDVTEPLVEAYELLEDNLLTKEQLKQFTYLNARNLYGSVLPSNIDAVTRLQV